MEAPVIVSSSREHKRFGAKTSSRFNLPDDDILFLYLAALEYTVKLSEDILIRQMVEAIKVAIFNKRCLSFHLSSL